MKPNFLKVKVSVFEMRPFNAREDHVRIVESSRVVPDHYFDDLLKDDGRHFPDTEESLDRLFARVGVKPGKRNAPANPEPGGTA